VYRPNFFIIGAPKCGTTSLANYLRDHPKVFFPALKELHYFNSDMTYRAVRSESDYYSHFQSAGPEHLAIGEGSVLYLYSDVAVPRVIETFPGSKFIVIVRNPIDMVASWHAQVRTLGEDDVPEFEAAWRKQEARKSGFEIPAFCTDPSLLFYGRICSTGWQLKRLYGRVPREKVLVLFLEDLRRDPRSVYVQTLEFLEVPDDGREVFNVYNPRNNPIRSYSVQVAIRALYRLKDRLRIKTSFGVLPVFLRLNSAEPLDESIEPQLKAELADYFRSDVEELSALVDRDLTGWLRV
jgi:Sulfotransferase domain